MVRFSIRKYPDRKMEFPFKPTGKTRIVTSYTTYKEQIAHKTPKRCKYLGIDMSVEGPKKKPIIVYRVFEVCKRSR